MRTANFVRYLPEGWAGLAVLFELRPPFQYDDRLVTFVIASASAKAPGPPEVALFEATAEGAAVNLGDTIVKAKHTLDLIVVIELLGYQPTSMLPPPVGWH